MNYDLLTQQGTIIANTALLSARDLAWATEVMRPVFRHRFGMGTRLGVVREGQVFAGTKVPAGMVLLATACSVTVNGVFLKHGIPVTSRYGGLLEVRQWRPFRFVALIDYGGTTLDPLEAFIRAKMTRVRDCARTGNGIIGVSFREVPTPALAEVARITKAMNEQGLDGILAVGTPNQPLLDVPVAEGRAGLVIAGGLNPLAALHESASLPKFHSLADVVDQGLLPPLRL
jgi:repressor of nif and glnA expression